MRSVLVGPIYVRLAVLRKKGRLRQVAKIEAEAEVASSTGVTNFLWWSLAAAASFVPSAIVAIAFDAILEQVSKFESPTGIGIFLMATPLCIGTWFLVRWVATGGAGKIGLIDDLGVVIAVTAAVLIALVT